MPYDALIKPSGWSGQLQPYDLEPLVRRIANGINGDKGGSYAPATPTSIHGSGLAVGKAPTYSFPRERTVHISALECAFETAQQSYEIAEGATRFQALNLLPSGSKQKPLTFPLTRLSDGKRLSRIVLEFYVPAGITALPTTFPIMDVRRLDPSTGIAESLRAAGAVTYPTPTTVDDYITGIIGAPPNTVTSVPDDPMSLIDMSQYVYWVTFTDAQQTMDPTDLSGATSLSGSTYLHSFAVTSVIDDMDFQ